MASTLFRAAERVTALLSAAFGIGGLSSASELTSLFRV